jgi:hypothetical protein
VITREAPRRPTRPPDPVPSRRCGAPRPWDGGPLEPVRRDRGARHPDSETEAAFDSSAQLHVKGAYQTHVARLPRLMPLAQLRAVSVETLCEILHKTVPLNTPNVTANAMAVNPANAMAIDPDAMPVDLATSGSAGCRPLPSRRLMR